MIYISCCQHVCSTPTTLSSVPLTHTDISAQKRSPDVFHNLVKYEKRPAGVRSLPPNNASLKQHAPPPVAELVYSAACLMQKATGRRAAANRKNKRRAAEKLSINRKTCGELGHDQS